MFEIVGYHFRVSNGVPFVSENIYIYISIKKRIMVYKGYGYILKSYLKVFFL